MDLVRSRVVARAERIRLARGLSRAELARAAGVPYGRLRRWLESPDEGMRSSSIVALARALGVDPSELTKPLEPSETAGVSPSEPETAQ